MVTTSIMLFIFMASIVIAAGSIVNDSNFRTNKTVTAFAGIIFFASIWFTQQQSITPVTPFLQMMVATIFITLATLAHRLAASPPASKETPVIAETNLVAVAVQTTPEKTKRKVYVSPEVYKNQDVQPLEVEQEAERELESVS